MIYFLKKYKFKKIYKRSYKLISNQKILSKNENIKSFILIVYIISNIKNITLNEIILSTHFIKITKSIEKNKLSNFQKQMNFFVKNVQWISLLKSLQNLFKLNFSTNPKRKINHNQTINFLSLLKNVQKNIIFSFSKNSNEILVFLNFINRYE